MRGYSWMVNCASCLGTVNTSFLSNVMLRTSHSDLMWSSCCVFRLSLLRRSNILLRELIQPLKKTVFWNAWLAGRTFSPLCIWLYRDFVNNINMIYSTPAICLLIKLFQLFRAWLPKHDSARSKRRQETTFLSVNLLVVNDWWGLFISRCCLKLAFVVHVLNPPIW